MFEIIEHLEKIVVMECRISIQRRGLGVDDYDPAAAAPGCQRQRCRRLDGETAAEHQQKFGLLHVAERLIEQIAVEGFPVEDDVRLDDAAAGAVRYFAREHPRRDFGITELLPASQTVVVGRAAVMELDYKGNYYKGFVKTALVPMLFILAMSTVVMIFSKQIGAFIGG